MSFFVPLLFILGFTGTLMLATKLRFGRALPIALMLCALIVYVFTLAGSLQAGFVFVVICAVAFPLLLVVLAYYKKCDLSEFKERALTPGLAVFLVIYAGLYFYTAGRGFSMWDEFSHWGPVVRETLRLNDFYSVSPALDIHKNYPPIVPLFESVWCKLAGGFAERTVYHSLGTLMLSLFVPVFEEIRWKKKILMPVKLALTLIALCSVVLIFQPYYLSSIYLEALMGLLMAYGLFCVFTQGKPSFAGGLEFVVLGCFLLLAKQIGAAAFGFLTIWYLVCFFTGKKACFKKHWPMLLACLAVPLLFNLSWSRFVAARGIEGQFDAGRVSIAGFLDIVKNRGGQPWQRETFVNFVDAVLTRPLIRVPLALTFWQIMLFVAAMFGGLVFWCKGIFQKARLIALNVVLALGAAGWAGVHMLLYIFTFNEVEGPGLASFNRYMNTYFIGAFALWVMLFCFALFRKESQKGRRVLAELCVVCIWIWVVFLPRETPMALIPRRNISARYAPIAQRIAANTDPDGRVFIVGQEQTGEEKLAMYYLLLPQKCIVYGLKEPKAEDSWLVMNPTPEEWINDLAAREYKYLYLLRIDDSFIEKYNGLFPPSTVLWDDQLYRINRLDNGISFDLIK
ncbi:MAG: hypothetical protein FWD16_00635 [Clostridia bacterium]|nr:hypothetical protein [Clostridia bacterium]